MSNKFMDGKHYVVLQGGDQNVKPLSEFKLVDETLLADGKIFVGAATGKAADVTMTGVVAITNTGVTSVALLSATAGAATASKAVILNSDKHQDEVNTAKLSIGATGAEVEVTATPAELNTLDRTGAAGAAEASKAVVLNSDKHLDEVNTAKLSIGATGAEVQITATPAHINLYTDRVNSLIDHLSDGLLISSVLAIGTTPAKFATSAISAFRIATVAYAKAAEDEIEFSAVETVNSIAAEGIMFGIWLVQVNAAGAVSTKAPATDQTYGSADDAIAALPAVDASNVSLGYILVESPTLTAFTTQTTSLATVGSYVDSAVATLPAKLA